jgi:RING finger/CHY zinc finger protein 1
MNCSNFKSNCEIYVDCCKQYICCYLCHDRTKHDFSYKKEISHIKCRKCKFICEKKNFSNECPNCKIQFNKTFCSKCLLWFNFKESFHCDDCSYCIMGNKNEFIHCKECDICIYHKKINYHKCHLIKEQNECYICLESLYEKRHNNRIFRCGHTIHRECFDKIEKISLQNKTLIKCGLCRELIY